MNARLPGPRRLSPFPTIQKFSLFCDYCCSNHHISHHHHHHRFLSSSPFPASSHLFLFSILMSYNSSCFLWVPYLHFSLPLSVLFLLPATSSLGYSNASNLLYRPPAGATDHVSHLHLLFSDRYNKFATSNTYYFR